MIPKQEVKATLELGKVADTITAYESMMRWHSLEIPPSGGWVEDGQLQTVIWANDKDLE